MQSMSFAMGQPAGLSSILLIKLQRSWNTKQPQRTSKTAVLLHSDPNAPANLWKSCTAMLSPEFTVKFYLNPRWNYIFLGWNCNEFRRIEFTRKTPSNYSGILLYVLSLAFTETLKHYFSTIKTFQKKSFLGNASNNLEKTILLNNIIIVIWLIKVSEANMIMKKGGCFHPICILALIWKTQ